MVAERSVLRGVRAQESNRLVYLALIGKSLSIILLIAVAGLPTFSRNPASSSGRMRNCLTRGFWGDQVLGCHDLPAPVTPNPSVGPNKSSALTAVSLPGFVALCDGCVAVEPDFHSIKVIRSEIFRRV